MVLKWIVYCFAKLLKPCFVFFLFFKDEVSKRMIYRPGFVFRKLKSSFLTIAKNRRGRYRPRLGSYGRQRPRTGMKAVT